MSVTILYVAEEKVHFPHYPSSAPARGNNKAQHGPPLR